ncbi:MAG: O-methyltransferase [Bacteroidales bacterium]|nr:O-methyltransferase [Bacteroidales bacterium]
MEKDLRYEELDNALDEYVRAHIDPEPELLHQVQRLTHLRLTYPRMCSGHLQGRLLKMLCQMVGAHRILELGTYSGYSALSMAEALTPDPVNGQCELHTIEVFDELEDFLRDVMHRAGELGRRVHLHFGDALDIIPQLEGPFDVVFIDADKRIYDQYYELILPLVHTGGLILADNTLWDGKVLNPSPSERDTQTIGLRRFNDLIARDSRVQKVILPMRDGLTIIRKL